MKQKYIFTVLYFASPIVPILALYKANSEKYTQINYLISMILGATAFTWMVNEFVLIARPKFIEKYFGLDKVYRFHGIMAILSLLLIFLHGDIEESLVGESSTGQLAFVIFGAITLLSFLFMVDSIVSRIKVISYIKKKVRSFKIFKYEFQVFLHNASIVALVIMYVHVITTSMAKYNNQVAVVYTVYFMIAVGFYIYHKFLKRFIFKKNIYAIIDVIKENENIWTLKLKPRKGKIFDYKPGQFGFIKIFGSNIKAEEHPFSISSKPGDEYVSMTIKELGDYTEKIQLAKNGYTAYIDAPYGKFCHVDYPEEKELLFIVGGVGITPVLSMLRYIREHDSDRNVIVIWGINTRDDIILIDEIQGMKNEMKMFHFVPVVLNDDLWVGEKGVVSSEKIKKILDDLGQDIATKGCYVCGPEIMRRNIVISLKQIGVHEKKIHFEKFAM